MMRRALIYINICTMALNLCLLFLPYFIFGQNIEAYYTKPEDVLALYQMMKDTHEILQVHGITYWIHAGTLLGAVRHKGLIPWDDDCDICIDKNDKEKFFLLKTIFEELGYELQPIYFGYKISPQNGRYTSHGDFKFPWIDVMLWEEYNDFFRYERTVNDLGWLYTLSIQRTDLFPLREYEFGELYLMGPRNPYPYLDFVYKNWAKIGVISNHSTNFRREIVLTDQDKIPAVPMGPLKDGMTN